MLREELGDIDPSSGEDLFDGGGLADVPVEITSEKRRPFEMLFFLVEEPSFQYLLSEGVGIGMIASSRNAVNNGTPPWNVGLNEDVKTL